MIRQILIMALLTSSVFGANEIYTWGYHDLVSESLIGLSMFLEQQDENLMKIVFAFGLLMMMMSVLKQKTHSMIGFEFAKLIVLLLLAQNLFLKTSASSIHTFTVIDRVTGQATTVNKVPVGVGQTLSIFTSIEDAIMKRMEVSFSMPNSNSYRQAGLGFNLAAPMEIFKSKTTNPWTERTITAYLEDCKFKGDFQTGQDYSELFYATDLTTVLATQNHLLSHYYTASNPEGILYDCSELWTLIENSITSESANMLSAIASRFGMNQVTFQDKSDVAMSTMVNSTTGSQQNLFQAILRNTSLESVNKIASSLGMNVTTLVRNKSVAEYSMTNDAILSTLQAQGVIPIMKAMVLVIIVTISWILALLTIATLNPSYLKMFFTLNLWLLLWGPLFLILNYAIDIMAAREIGSHIPGVTAQNQIDIFGALGAKVAILSKVVWSVPMLAFAIAKGSEHAMTSFIGGMGQGASAAVSGALQQQTRDVVMGRTDFLNLQTNKAGGVTAQGTQDKSSLATEYGQVNRTNTGNVLEMENLSAGAKVTAGDTQINHESKNLSANSTQAIEAAYTDAKERVAQTASSLAKNWINSNATVQQSGDGYTVSTKDGKTAQITKQDAEAYQEVNSVALKEGYSAGIKQASGTDLKKLEAAMSKVTGSMEAGASIDGFIKAGGKISKSSDGSVSLSVGGSVVETFDASSGFAKEYNASYQKSLTHQLSESQSASLAIDRIHGATYQRSDAETNQAQTTIGKAFSNSNSLKEAYSEVVKNGESAQQNLLNAAMNEYIKREGGFYNKPEKRKWFDEKGNFKNEFVKDEAALAALKKDAELQSGKADFADFLSTYGVKQGSEPSASDPKFKNFDQKMQDGKELKAEVKEAVEISIEDGKNKGFVDENGKVNMEASTKAIRDEIGSVNMQSKQNVEAVNSPLVIRDPSDETVQKTNFKGTPGPGSEQIQSNLDGAFNSNIRKHKEEKASIEEEHKNSTFLGLLEKSEGNELAIGAAALMAAAGAKYAPQIRDAISERLQGTANADEFAKVASEIDQAATTVEKAMKSGKGGAGTLEAFESLGLAQAAEKNGFVFNKDGSIDEKATSIKQSGLRAEAKLEEAFAPKQSNTPHPNANVAGADDIKVGGGKAGALLTVATMLGMGAVAANADENANGGMIGQTLNHAFNQEAGAGIVTNTFNAANATAQAFDPTISGVKTVVETAQNTTTHLESGNYGDAALEVLKTPVTFVDNVINDGKSMGYTAHALYDQYQNNQSVFNSASEEQLQQPLSGVPNSNINPYVLNELGLGSTTSFQTPPPTQPEAPRAPEQNGSNQGVTPPPTQPEAPTSTLIKNFGGQ
ncbi:MAG: conjugal transfer protein TraG N-terminal domain-containing protein [Candidatus Cloacimonetes bacterium]|nr:conjugal transfer protein TraG N-terminal domain-containing protein [Candidatus Cloacimonadota bacterium]